MRSRVIALGLCLLGSATVWVSGSTPSGTKAWAVVALAATGALIATRGWVRREIAGLIGILGIMLVLGGTVLAVIAGLLVIAGGVVAVVTCPQWPVMGARYERSPKAEDVDLWSALDRGEDPTATPR